MPMRPAERSTGANDGLPPRSSRPHVRYRPLVEIATMQLVGAEVQCGDRRPSDVIDAVCEDVARAVEGGSDWWVLIALGDLAGLQHVTSSQVAAALDRWGVEPERLVLEVSERAIGDAVVQRLLHEASDHGVRCGLSEFGAGWSSLAELRALPFELVRLDASLAVKPPIERTDLLMATIALAQAEDLDTLASDVGDGEDLLLLGLAECDLATGPWWGPPASLGDLDARFAAYDAASRGGAWPDRGPNLRVVDQHEGEVIDLVEAEAEGASVEPSGSPGEGRDPQAGSCRS